MAEIPSEVHAGNAVTASWSGFMISLGKCEVNLMRAEATNQRVPGESHVLLSGMFKSTPKGRVGPALKPSWDHKALLTDTWGQV